MDMTQEHASTQPSRNFRQTLEGMPLFFNPAAAEGMKADIQFNASGRVTSKLPMRPSSATMDNTQLGCGEISTLLIGQVL